MSAADDIEWLTPATTQRAADVDLAPARGLVVGPGEILVVVLPSFATMEVLEVHRKHFQRILGDRFVMISGGDVRLAKVRSEDWGPGAFDGEAW